MPYAYDVFISYRRHAQWPLWVERHFVPIFEHWLGEELGQNVKIFWDNGLETGYDWPVELGFKLASSRVLVPLLSRQYFNSLWCRTELALMCARENAYGLGGKSRPERLIVPAILHDGDDLPHEIRIIQAAKLQECSNVSLADNSPKREMLSDKIRAWVPDVVKAIQRAPEHDPAWVELAADELLKLFQMPEAKQVTLPTLG